MRFYPEGMDRPVFLLDYYRILSSVQSYTVIANRLSSTLELRVVRRVADLENDW